MKRGFWVFWKTGRMTSYGFPPIVELRDGETLRLVTRNYVVIPNGKWIGMNVDRRLS